MNTPVNSIKRPRPSRNGAFIRLGLALLSSFLFFAAPAMASEGAGNPWADLLYKVINFAILAALFYWVLRKPVPEFLRSNAAQAKAELAQTREAHAKALRELAEQKELIGGLEAELKKMAAQAREDAEKEKAHLMEDARKQAERIKTQLRMQMEQEVLNAASALRKEIAGEMVRLVEQTLPKRVDGTASTKLFKDFMSHLEARR